MYFVNATNVNDALTRGLSELIKHGEANPSRNGPVVSLPAPCITVYKTPTERVLFSDIRDANPYFHFFEALWMLAGRNDLEFPVRFVKRFAEYSDDGEVLHGAYGFRWREFFGFDQIEELVKLLDRDPNTRRAVLGMWSPSGDLVASEGYGGINSRDIPCNTHVYFERRGASLNMTVLCRSNDAIWGAYGANAVHFSVLLEYMAARLSCRVGVMRQFSHNLHVYSPLAKSDNMRALRESERDLYALGLVKPYPLVRHSTIDWDEDLKQFMDYFDNEPFGAKAPFWNEVFFQEVAVPMFASHAAYKDGDLKSAMGFTYSIAASDWRTACREWLLRRASKKGVAL